MLRPLRAARGQKPGVQLAAIDVHNHAMPLPLLEWFERTRLSATNTYRTRCLGYASAGRAAMLGDLSTAIPTQDGEPRH